MSEIVRVEPAEVAGSSASFLEVVARAASDPTIDVGKMSALLDMQERLANHAAEVAFKAALARIQPQMPKVAKAGIIRHKETIMSRFARYQDLDYAIRPLLAHEGFALDFDTAESAGKLTVILRVSHSAGHSERRQITLPMDTSGAKNPVQGVGSTFTYGKRYLVANFFNIITTDDPADNDGNGDYISLDQQTEIDDLITETGANRERFLNFIGADTVPMILARNYQRAVNALRSKRK